MTEPCDHIELVRLKDRGHSIVAVFRGYGQELKIYNLKDGAPPAVSINPLDPLCGVIVTGAISISDLKHDDGTDLLELRWPISPCDVERTKANLDNAALFCEEYRRRRKELFRVAGYDIQD